MSTKHEQRAERDRLATVIETAYDLNPGMASFELLAHAILAAGYRKPQQVTTRAEANALPDRSAILTPGQIIFRKWANYYAEGKDAWERELGQMVPAELLSEEGHFPATVLHVGGAE